MDAEDAAAIAGQIGAVEFAVAALMARHPDKDALLRAYRERVALYEQLFPDTQFGKPDPEASARLNAVLLGQMRDAASRIETLARAIPPST